MPYVVNRHLVSEELIKEELGRIGRDPRQRHLPEPCALRGEYQPAFHEGRLFRRCHCADEFYQITYALLGKQPAGIAG
jgi:hypothetical protein